MFGGLTVAVAAIIDIVSFLVTPHLAVCYALARLVYSVVKDALGGLWAVFRGALLFEPCGGMLIGVGREATQRTAESNGYMGL
jgi:N-acetylglucosaminyl transferase component (Gpi1)